MNAPGPERPAPDTAPGPDRSALERRYRRLLRCYPPGHREVHREEVGGPAIVAAAWLAVVLLVRAGRRRTAAAIVFALLAVGLTDLLTGLMYRAGAWSGGLPPFVWTAGGGPVVLVSLAACSLAFSAGPRPGLAIAGKRRACLMVAGLSVIFGYATVIFLLSPSARLPAPVSGVLDVLAIMVAIVITRVPGAAGGRVAALIVAGLLPGLAAILPFQSIPTTELVSLSATLLVAVLVWPVAIASWRARVSRESRATAR